MEVFSSVVFLSLFVLAIFMYFKTREPRPSPVVGLDLKKFSPISDPPTAARVREAGRACAGIVSEAISDEKCESDGERFLYRAKVGSGSGAAGVRVLLDGDCKVLGTTRSIAM